MCMILRGHVSPLPTPSTLIAFDHFVLRIEGCRAGPLAVFTTPARQVEMLVGMGGERESVFCGDGTFRTLVCSHQAVFPD